MHYKNKVSTGGSILFLCRLALIAGLTSCAIHAVATAAESYTVVLSQGCPYIMAEGDSDQFLGRVIRGDAPQLGDTLEGPVRRGSSITLNNVTRNAAVTFDIEIVESLTSTRGALRYSQLCSM